MAEPPVVNASPLICMARAGLLELLNVEGPEAIITEALNLVGE